MSFSTFLSSVYRETRAADHIRSVGLAVCISPPKVVVSSDQERA